MRASCSAQSRWAAIGIIMKSHDPISKRRIILLTLILFVLLILLVLLTQPYFVHRLSSKLFTSYEIYLLKYPDSKLVEKEILATSKISMATHYKYHSLDDIDIVLEYMDQQLPGFVQLGGSRVINEPTFRNTICADVTLFEKIYEFLDKGTPCIDVSIYPSSTSGTTIRVSENWVSMGFPRWLIGW